MRPEHPTRNSASQSDRERASLDRAVPTLTPRLTQEDRTMNRSSLHGTGSSGATGRTASRSRAPFAVALLTLLLGGPIVSRTVTAEPLFLRGDSNSDGAVDIADTATTLGYLFLGGNIPCGDAADSNDDGALDVSDPVHTLRFLFLGGTPVPAPGPHECGPDPTADGLGECNPLGCSEEMIDDIAPPFVIQGGDAEAIQGLFQTGFFQDALDQVLNSPGDSIELDLEAKISIPIVALLNVNLERSFTAQIALNDRRAYEVSVSLDTMGRLGIELWEGLEGNGGLARGGKAILEFSNLPETVRALNDMALTLIARPAIGALEDALAAGINAVDGAVSGVDTALATLQQKLQEREGLVGGLIHLQDQLNGLIHQLNDARARVVDFLQGVAQNFCDRFPRIPPCPKIAEIQAFIDGLQAQRRQIVDQIASTENQLALLDNVIAGARTGLQLAEDALAAATAHVLELEEVTHTLIDALIGAQDRIGLAAAKVELYFGATGELALSALPGITIGGIGLGARLEQDMGTIVLVTLGPDLRPVAASTKWRGRLRGGATAARRMGVEGTAFAEISRQQDYVFTSGWFDQVGESAELMLDAYGEIVRGVVLTKRIGAGRQLKIGLGPWIPDLMELIVDTISAGDFTPLAGALLGLEVTVTRADRSTRGGAFEFGASYAGYGGGVKGVAVWQDTGDFTPAVIGAAAAIAGIFPRIDTLLGDVLDGIADEASRRS